MFLRKTYNVAETYVFLQGIVCFDWHQHQICTMIHISLTFCRHWQLCSSSSCKWREPNYLQGYVRKSKYTGYDCHRRTCTQLYRCQLGDVNSIIFVIRILRCSCSQCNGSLLCKMYKLTMVPSIVAFLMGMCQPSVARS